MTSSDSSKLIFHVTQEQRQALLSPDPAQFRKAFDSILQNVRDTFNNEGVVLIRGLFDEDLLDLMCKEGEAIVDAVKFGNTFTSLQFGPIFSFPGTCNNEKLSGEAFREAALASSIPAFVARVLLRLDDEEEGSISHEGSTLRLLKDAFMAKGKEQNYCGWHVDDAGFWPTDAQSEGINAWIALDDMESRFGGGLAVSPKSHHAEWRHEAYKAIGSTKIFPPEGVQLGDEKFREVYGKTCSMNILDPQLNQKIESTKEVFDYKRGDCLFCTRWLFHRSVAINEEGLEHIAKLGSEKGDYAFKRYTIRYELGSAKALRGLSMEACNLLYPEATAGKSLDAICEAKGPFYPKCWPRSPDLKALEAEIQSLVKNDLPKAEIKRSEMIAKIKDSYSAN